MKLEPYIQLPAEVGQMRRKLSDTFREISAAVNSILPGSANEVSYNGVGALTTSSNFTYDQTTNTVTFGNITGSALGMNVRTKTPSVTESPGTIDIRGATATKSNTAGGSVLIKSGVGTGTQAGVATVSIQSEGADSSISMNDAILTILGPGTGALNFEAGAFNFVGGYDPTELAENLFQSGVNDVGSMPFKFATDSGPAFEIAEPTFGSQRISFYGVTPVIKQTTSIATISRTAVGGGNAIDDNDTFGGYTIGQIVTALKAYGLLA